MPRYWLMKSEPDVYSIDDLARDRRTFWNGVRNYQARNLLRDMEVGERVLFYHSNAEPPAVVGIAEVLLAAEPDPTQFDRKSEGYDADASKQAPRWWGVTVGFVDKLPRAVGLPELKREKKLAKMVLLNRSRLSVQPVTEVEWRTIIDLSRR